MGSSEIKTKVLFRITLLFLSISICGFSAVGFLRLVDIDLFKYEILIPLIIISGLSFFLSLFVHIKKSKKLGMIAAAFTIICGLVYVGVISYTIYQDHKSGLGSGISQILTYILAYVLALLHIGLGIPAWKWTRSLGHAAIFPVDVSSDIKLDDTNQDKKSNSSAVHPAQDKPSVVSQKPKQDNLVERKKIEVPKPARKANVSVAFRIPTHTEEEEPFIVPISQSKPDEVNEYDSQVINTPFFILKDKKPINIYSYSPNINQIISPIIEFITGNQN